MTSESPATRQDTREITVICLGETMLMFGPPPHEVMGYCVQFIAMHGGAESNVAIGMERLGMHAAWIGKLPRNALGRKIVNELRAFGVDTTAVVWTDTGRVGKFFVEWGARPRPLKTIYDRANSVATTLVADDLDWDFIARAKWLQMTGITPATSETCRKSVPEIVARARALGVKVLFDVNYRSLLWSRDEAKATCEKILPYVNLLTATEIDTEIVLGRSLPREVAVRTLFDMYDFDAVVMTLGGEGSLGYDGTSFYSSTGYEVETVNRMGAGDAYDAGLLYGYLGAGLQTGLYYGTAFSALKLTIPQNIPIIDKEDVDQLLSGRSIDVVR